jgi:hypothetical protein
MRICAFCGIRTVEADGELCAHHTSSFGEGSNWATGNRIMCDFIHRGVVPPTPPEFRDALIESLLEELEEPAAA